MTLGLCVILTQGTSLSGQAGQPKPGELRAKIVRDLPGWLKQYNVPSASVAYIADDKLAWTAIAGEQEAGVPATDHTLYNIASLTKPIVAETILRMIFVQVARNPVHEADLWTAHGRVSS